MRTGQNVSLERLSGKPLSIYTLANKHSVLIAVAQFNFLILNIQLLICRNCQYTIIVWC